MLSCLVLIRQRSLQFGARRFDAALGSGQLAAGVFQVGPGRQQGDLVGLAVDLEEGSAFFHELVVVYPDLCDDPGNLGRHTNDKSLKPGLLGVRSVAVCSQVPAQCDQDDQQYQRGARNQGLVFMFF